MTQVDRIYQRSKDRRWAAVALDIRTTDGHRIRKVIYGQTLDGATKARDAFLSRPDALQSFVQRRLDGISAKTARATVTVEMARLIVRNAMLEVENERLRRALTSTDQESDPSSVRPRRAPQG